MIFDTHAHYDDEAFDEDRDQLLSSMKDGECGCIVNVCASSRGIWRDLGIDKAYPFVYGAVGVHPDDAGIMTQDTLDEIRRLSHLKKMVAIGKRSWITTGIRKRQSINSSRRCSRRQMDIAREESCQYMIHSREASRGHSGDCKGIYEKE